MDRLWKYTLAAPAPRSEYLGHLKIDNGEQVYIHVVVVLNGGAWTLAGALYVH